MRQGTRRPDPASISYARRRISPGWFSSSPPRRRASLFPDLLAPQDVPGAADRLDHLGFFWVRLDLGTQPVDVNVNRARLAGIVVAPDIGQQLFAREDLSRIAQQEGQEIESPRFDRSNLSIAQRVLCRNWVMR